MILRLPDPSVLAMDLGLVLRASNSIGPEGLSRGAWLLNTDRFGVWAQIPNSSSDLILVDGHLGKYCWGKISPLSVLSATLASMKKLPLFIILTHFCGLHTSPGDPMSGCRGMLRNLIAQLIMAHRNNSHSNSVCLDELLLQGISQHSLDALFQLFQELLSRIPQGVTVYCVLDDIAQFETDLEGWGAELCWVVSWMQALTSQYRRGPVLKVLLTTAMRSTVVFRQIEASSIISLSAGNRSSRPSQQLGMETGWSQAIYQQQYNTLR